MLGPLVARDTGRLMVKIDNLVWVVGSAEVSLGLVCVWVGLFACFGRLGRWSVWLLPPVSLYCKAARPAVWRCRQAVALPPPLPLARPQQAESAQ